MRLFVQSGPQTGQAYDIVKETSTIGRASNSDILIADQSVSRQHAKLQRLTNGFVLSDLHGTNGTFVNNVRIASPTQIHPGDTIRVGQTVLVLQESAEMVMPASGALHGDVPPAQPVARTSNSKPLIAVGIGAIVGLLFLGGLFFILPNFAVAPTATPQSTSVAANTSIPTGVSETPQPTLQIPVIASVNANQSPTAIAFATVTATNLPSPSATVLLRRPTLVPSATATVLILNDSRTYAAPEIVSPSDHKKFTSEDKIEFAWIPFSNLQIPDYYRLQIATDAEFRNIACEIRTRNASGYIRGAGHRCTENWKIENRYFWRLEVVTGDITTGANERSLTSPPAPTYDFVWE